MEALDDLDEFWSLCEVISIDVPLSDRGLREKINNLIVAIYREVTNLGGGSLGGWAWAVPHLSPKLRQILDSLDEVQGAWHYASAQVEIDQLMRRTA
jgi:hypothetical protein